MTRYITAIILFLAATFQNRLAGTTARRKQLPTEPTSWLNRLKDFIPEALGHALVGLLFALAVYLIKAEWTNKTVLFMTLGAFLTVFLGNLLGRAPGWGKYFPGSKDTSAEKEVGIVDNIADALCGKYTSATPLDKALNWKTVAMVFRFLIFYTPKYIALCFVLQMAWPLVGLLALPLAAVMYRIVYEANPNKDNTHLSEIFAGMTLAGVDASLLLLIAS